MAEQKQYINITTTLDGVTKSFRELLLCNEMRPHFVNVMKSIDPHDISPGPVDIFHFAKYKEVDNINVVVIGQDPYPNPAHAHGLCFSSLNKRVPSSLRNIYACLEEHKMLNQSARDTKTADLTSWAKQGVLMLNMSLTTKQWKSATHMALWEPITTHIVKTLGAVDRPIVFLLWGNFAKKMKAHITSKQAIVLEETHPSPMAQSRLPADKKFAKCNHFVRTNEILKAAGLPPIVWDPMAELPKVQHRVYTDGSGLNTGDVNSKASYATLFAAGPSAGSLLFGRLSPMCIIDIHAVAEGKDWSPEQNPCWFSDKRGYTIKGAHYKTKEWPEPLAVSYLPNVDRDMIFPTSQRGEGTAILMALEHVIKIGAPCHVDIVTDSMFWKDMIEKFIPSWVDKGRPFELQKNPDLVTRMWQAMQTMKSSDMTFALQHIKSHGKDKDADPLDVKFNDIVDQKALSIRDSRLFGDHREYIDL
jgi:uracil-DNA glycosylase